MSFEENKAAVGQLFAAVNARDLERALELVTDDVIVHTQVPGIEAGRDGFRTFLSVFFAAFPEQSVTVHVMVAEGDRVLARHTHHVVHGGHFAGMPPTGKRATVDGLELFRLQDGRIAEMWHHDDLLGLLQQLGAIPGPEHAAV
jgi:steroid delta-isomerase-like uncharacterized protein